MFNPTSGLWSAELPPPPRRAQNERFWCDAWEHYCVLYERFERARIDPYREGLKEAIAALSQCDYVHLSSNGLTRAIQAGPGVVRDITDRHCLVMRRPEAIIWCADDTLNLNTRTMQMKDMSGAEDDAMVLQGAEPESSSSCIYLTKDPRTSYTYANALWLVATQVARPGVY